MLVFYLLLGTQENKSRIHGACSAMTGKLRQPITSKVNHLFASRQSVGSKATRVCPPTPVYKKSLTLVKSMPLFISKSWSRKMPFGRGKWALAEELQFVSKACACLRCLWPPANAFVFQSWVWIKLTVVWLLVPSVLPRPLSILPLTRVMWTNLELTLSPRMNLNLLLLPPHLLDVGFFFLVLRIEPRALRMISKHLHKVSYILSSHCLCACECTRGWVGR